MWPLPASTSATLIAVPVPEPKIRSVSSSVDCAPGTLCTGASLTGFTVILNVVSARLPPAPSDTVNVKLSLVVSLSSCS